MPNKILLLLLLFLFGCSHNIRKIRKHKVPLDIFTPFKTNKDIEVFGDVESIDLHFHFKDKYQNFQRFEFDDRNHVTIFYINYSSKHNVYNLKESFIYDTEGRILKRKIVRPLKNNLKDSVCRTIWYNYNDDLNKIDWLIESNNQKQRYTTYGKFDAKYKIYRYFTFDSNNNLKELYFYTSESKLLYSGWEKIKSKVYTTYYNYDEQNRLINEFCVSNDTLYNGEKFSYNDIDIYPDSIYSLTQELQGSINYTFDEYHNWTERVSNFPLWVDQGEKKVTRKIKYRNP